MDIDQLKQEYPELMNFLYNTSNDRSYVKESRAGFRPRTTKPSVTLGENSFVYYNSTSKMLEGKSLPTDYYMKYWDDTKNLNYLSTVLNTDKVLFQLTCKKTEKVNL